MIKHFDLYGHYDCFWSRDMSRECWNNLNEDPEHEDNYGVGFVRPGFTKENHSSGFDDDMFLIMKDNHFIGVLVSMEI